jgi:hypothetical protein
MVPVFFVVLQKQFAPRAAKKADAIAPAAPIETADTPPLH